MEILAEDLPKGVSCEHLTIPADLPSGLLFFEATEDAELGTDQLQFIARAVIAGKRVSHSVQAIAGSKPLRRDKRGRVSKETGKAVNAAYLTVLDEAPFKINWLTLSA